MYKCGKSHPSNGDLGMFYLGDGADGGESCPLSQRPSHSRVWHSRLDDFAMIGSTSADKLGFCKTHGRLYGTSGTLD